MKTLAAWIVGIFAIGLALGSFVSSSGARLESETTDFETALESAPLVECGEGREALLEPVVDDGKSTFKVRCVATTEEVVPRRAYESPRPAAPVAVASAPTHSAPVATAPVTATADTNRVETEKDSRSWKESAVVIGGAAGAGAGIGALAKGKKGAVVGAAIGAASGAAYELIKKDKK